MTLLFNTIKKRSLELFDETVATRRKIHENPELSFKEYKTTEYITSKLSELSGVEIIPSLETGVAGLLFPKKHKRTVLLRADTDALPILEESGLPFASKNKGIMHACGHDFHSASLLTTLKILSEAKDSLKTNIAFIFQPAEEKLPGGAKALMEKGIIDKINPDIVLGQHIEPDLPCGTIGMKEGEYMASADEIYIKVLAPGGHAALPHKTADTIVIASTILLQLQQVVSRIIPTTIPSILSFGKIIGNGATNILPPKVEIEGTLRTFSEEWRKKAKKHIVSIAKSTAESMGATCEIKIKDGYPVLKNDALLVQKSKKTMALFMTKNEELKTLGYRMTSEDFAYYTQKYSSLFYRVGVKNEEKETYGLHNAKLSINEDALKYAPSYMAVLAASL